VLSYPHDLVSPYYRAHQRDNRSREDDSFNPMLLRQRKTPSKARISATARPKLNTTTAAIEMNNARSCICIGNLSAVSEGEGRSLAWTMPQALRSCLHPTGNLFGEQDLNLAQQACYSRRSSIAAGRFAPAGSGAEGGTPFSTVDG
jgi:hypothetical protein